MVMEIEQELAWSKAQKIVLGVDLVEAAKRQLQFLADIDRRRYLYDGPVLEHAIYRYKYCWLPLLAACNKSHVAEASLVVPLDCEWIWHCHRLNPVQYKIDCEELYGKILDSSNVLSSVQGTCTKKSKEIWNRMYPSEPYDLDLREHVSKAFVEKTIQGVKSTNYDLAAAVKRQSSFTYQVSRPHMNDDTFLKEAVARYKGFLYLIKKNRQNSIKRFCVPTYDIDLIWHSHQLQPVSYCKDVEAITGNILQHDDTNSDKSKGGKLDSGFPQTTEMWEETFGQRYWKAGAMNRGKAPSILSRISHPLTVQINDALTHNDYPNVVQLPKKELAEVMIEILSARSVPSKYKGKLFVSLSKGHSDMPYNTGENFKIFTELGRRQMAYFHCEATGELVFELMASSPSTVLEASHAPATLLGSAAISLRGLFHPASRLSVQKWFDLNSNLEVEDSAPISLLIALSFTPPVPAPYIIHMIQPQSSSKIAFFLDENGNEIADLQMRDITRTKENYPQTEMIKSSTYCKTHTLAEFNGEVWSFMNSSWSFHQQENSGEDRVTFELIGNRQVILFPGKKLEYESSSHGKQEPEQDFLTAVEVSADNPYGKAIALLNLKSGLIEIKEEWMILPVMIATFIICNIKDGANKKAENNALPDVNMCGERDRKMNKITASKRAVIGEIGRKSMLWMPKHIGKTLEQENIDNHFQLKNHSGAACGDCKIRIAEVQETGGEVVQVLKGSYWGSHSPATYCRSESPTTKGSYCRSQSLTEISASGCCGGSCSGGCGGGSCGGGGCRGNCRGTECGAYNASGRCMFI